MRRCVAVHTAVIIAGLLLGAAAPANAQWSVSAFFGANRTEPGTVSINDPEQGLVQQFHDVHFDASPFTTPPYYGWRVEHVIRRQARFTFGLEFEFIHAKVYSDTTRNYVVTPGTGGTTTSYVQMNTTVQRYDMSHGLNFFLVNGVLHLPLTKSEDHPISLDLRLGLGPTMPHAESIVLGQSREQYEYGGIAFGVGGGVSTRVAGPVSAFLDYRFTVARPEIALAHGTGQASTFMQHLLLGAKVQIFK